jgi:hypothetical protein
MISPPTASLVVKTSKPILPNELMIDIFKMAHKSCPSSVVPAMATNKLWHSIIEPMVYDTVRLNRDTVEKLPNCILTFQSDSEDYISALDLESHQRKTRAFKHTTRLIIDDIPVMYRDMYHSAVQRFCNTVRLPNATTLIWAHDHSRVWLPTTDIGLGTYRLPRAVPVSVLPSHAWAFMRVLPASKKKVCIQVSSEMDDDREIVSPAIGGAYRRSTGDKRFVIRSIDRINEFTECMTGQIKLHIHQTACDDFLALASSPATYSFSKIGDDDNLESKLTRVFATYLMDSHTLPYQVHKRRGRDYFATLYETLARLSVKDLADKEKKEQAKALVTDYLRTFFHHNVIGVTFGDIVRGIVEDFGQMLAALAGAEGEHCAGCKWKGLAVDI